MFKLGTYQTLHIARKIDHGYILENDKGDEVLLPTKLVLDDIDIINKIRVFLYKDGEERITATMQDPKITLNSIALLRVKEVNKYGAYLDWGLTKDLFVPHSEQAERMNEDQSYLVYMYLDEVTNRLAATPKIDRFLNNDAITVEEKEKVDLWIWNRTDLGYNVIINEKHKGLIYHNEFFTDVNYGEQKTGYIKQIRPDNKIDVTLRPIGYKKVEPNADHILRQLKEAGGFLDLHDKSNPDEIRNRLEMSKKTFKKAIGLLYKKNIIRIEDNGIYLDEN
ncbi:MAG TPA: S1-like domain-containing RNA-binding protein [Balneolaceae bacterium]